MADQPYIYLFVRDDLSPAQKVIQVAHAVEEFTKRTAYYYPKSIDINITNFMVLFSVKDEIQLCQAANYLSDKGIVFEMFFEPDINQNTAIATEPLIGNRRKIMENFKLME